MFGRILIYFACLPYLSGIALFDSQISYDLPLPYPLLFFALALGWLIPLLLTISTSRLEGLTKPLLTIISLFGLLICIGWVGSIYNQQVNIYGLGSKSLTVLIIVLSFYCGFKLASCRRMMIEFSTMCFLLSLILAIFITVLFLEQFNNNWVALLVFFGMLGFYAAGKMHRSWAVTGFALFAAVSLLIFEARGVAITSLLLSTVLVVYYGSSIIGARKKKLLLNSLVAISVLASVLVTLLFIIFFETDIYYSADQLSREFFGKSIDSGRVVRWASAFEVATDRAAFGWGLDAALPRVSGYSGGDLHNVWMEWFFRTGLVGCAIFIAIWVTLFTVFSGSKLTPVPQLVIVAAVSLGTVYALGAVTHFPGTFALWFVLGVVMGRARESERNEKCEETEA